MKQPFMEKLRMKHWSMMLCCLMLFNLTVLAQDAKTISGVVNDATGEALIGVAVVNKTIGEGISTSIDGSFSIKAKPNDLIQFSYIGYATLDYTVNQQINIQITLKEDAQNLDEVLIVGYSAVKKSSITGAIVPVNMGDMGKRHVANVSQALQGQIAGIQITQSTGAPGDDISMLIRGVGTIGNNDPLYIIDGVPSRNMSFLNPNDIASISVLKDASSAAIYGSRASAGVVLITTKEGETGKGKLEVNYYYGVHNAVNLPKMLNATQYMDVVERSWNNAGYAGTNPYTADKNRANSADTNWLDELFTTGQTHTIQASVSGSSSQGLNYLLSTGYISQNGMVVYDNDKYERFTLRTNLNTKILNRFTVGANIQLTYSIQDRFNSKGDEPGIIRHALLRPPVLGVYKNPSDPTYRANDAFTDLPFYTHNNRDGGWESDKYEWTSNPIALAYFIDDKRSQYSTFGNIYGEYELLPDRSLKFKSNLGVDLSFYHNKAFNLNFGDDDGGGSDIDKGTGRQNRPTGLNEERSEALTLTWNNTLSYVKTVGDHNINAVIGSEFITNYESGIGASRQRFDYTSDAYRYLDLGNSSIAGSLWNSGLASEWALMSLFASATYVYQSKYMATANFRADGSSRFGSDNRWGYFPSVSVGWKISGENFLKDVPWLSDLKLRASFGQLGNQEIPNYTYLTLLKRDGDKYIVSRYGNPKLKWETSEQTNFGVDLGLLQNRIYLSVDYFVKNTFDILLPISLPSFAGDVLPTYVNSGKVKNQGIEVALTYRNSISDFKYSVNANIATLKNEVTQLHPNLPILDGQVTRSIVGQPLNSYYGFVMEGIYQNEDEIKQHLFDSPNTSVRPGDIRFKDLNGNGQIDDGDRDFLGSPTPKLTYGFTFNGEYKGFNLSLLFHGVNGVKRYNDVKKILDYDSRPFNYTTAVLNAWNGEGTSNTIPRPSFTDNGGSRVSNIFVEDASFFRLKNVELGYSFAKFLQKSNTGISDVKVYISGENLFTSTSYSALDPESTDLIDKGTYPQARTFLFGVNMKF